MHLSPHRPQSIAMLKVPYFPFVPSLLFFMGSGSFFLFLPPASISRCPALCAKALSVMAVRPEECFYSRTTVSTTIRLADCRLVSHSSVP